MKNQTEQRREPGGCKDGDGLPAGIHATLSVIGGKWKIPILFLLWRRTRRFGELRRELAGITQHMLTASLRDMERDGLLTRTVFPEVQPRVEYALTTHGSSLGAVFGALAKWGDRHRDIVGGATDGEATGI